jgi:cell wall-associated NlpC family hydrolase
MGDALEERSTLDYRRRIARAIIPAAALITILTVATPSSAAATDPVITEPTATLPAPADAAAPTETTPPAAPATTAPVAPAAVVAPAVVQSASHPHRRTAAQRLIAVARRKLGDRYVYGAMGPRHFDCSGLVIFALRHSHNGRVVSPGLRSARSFLVRYRRHHRASRHHGRPGDFVIWGGGRHIGIYLGHGRAISALTRRGVSVHRINAVTMPFTAFLHTHLASAR